jgi:hypothetical protein
MDQHPVFVQPKLHCGRCGHPLLFPKKVENDDPSGVALAECNVCCTAVNVPLSALAPHAPFHCEVTVARPWAV